MVDMKVSVEPHPNPQDRVKNVLFERCLQHKEQATIYPNTPQGNRALQQYSAILEVIRLLGMYDEFQSKGGAV